MNVLRSAIYVLWLAVTVVPWAILVLVYSIFVRGDRLYWFTMRWLRMAIWGARVICGVSHRIQGWENLPDSRIILCPKHQSTWETFAFPTLMPHPLCYVFKRELLLIPFFGWAMGRLDMIHIDRSRRAEAWNKVAEKGRLFMSRGSWVIMFPEGTRAPRGGQGAYKSGATRLAIATDTPVVPIAMNSARCWPRRSFVLRPGVIDISIGRPIPPAGRQPDEMMREVERWIESEMRRLDPEAYAPPAPAAQPT
ncbi:MAG TPA: lysophospholipid acyltransferase family protein [Piscinibacter sp.]|jgi:1-acyl-sn-glycerol-3-phosphate acyltransferase|uniref:lysophospholipid acyltransferase family protein n=1 Tax=Piscinibacter sp. TaxID=1903157 RepID=UPI001B50AB14|nr:lysophospholipid acyltransferase family protein [Piscinibacter sp.]MBK7531329.1 1-acyl-sn-glycerol-3-phosphate acyltransferase [Piscinibacter sp.]MBP6541966.1 1-acyl-sn-glycerol-3-phosphate acyltransferase [Piscinibacter sp.]HOY37437.1 lysophospholipid acyltransferase family protein [Piscinibacter sp.]HPG79339.1 lysophospholipid acyltransferase family protein [Piscinibacter sp.]HPM68912.1 lysophospholipid acyltransferase family protein [Piscinibacter sp.]